MTTTFTKKILLFLLLAGISLSTVFNRSRGFEDSASVDWHVAAEALVAVAIAGVLILSARQRRDTWQRLAGTSGRPLLWFYAWCLVLAPLSPLISYAAFRAFQFFVHAFAVYVIFSSYRSDDYANAERGFVYFGLSVALLGISMHLARYGVLPSLIKLHTNSYSASAVMVFSYCAGELLSRRQDGKFFLMISGGCAALLVVVGTSTSSYLAGLCGLATAFLISGNYLMLVLSALTAGILAVLMSYQDLLELLFFGKKATRVGTVSGRDVVWQYLWTLFLERKFSGYGVSVANRVGEVVATNAHNALFSVALGGGIGGLVIVAVACARVTREALNALRKRIHGSTGAAAALVSAIVNSFSISYYGDYWMPPSAVFMAVSAFMLLVVREQQVPYTTTVARANDDTRGAR